MVEEGEVWEEEGEGGGGGGGGGGVEVEEEEEVGESNMTENRKERRTEHTRDHKDFL